MAIVIVFIIIGLLIVMIGIFGGFYKVNIQTVNTGGEILVYENVTGSYNQASKISNKVYYELLNNFKIETTKGFGIYYDNPKNVDQNKLRSEVGCIVENGFEDGPIMEIYDVSNKKIIYRKFLIKK